MTTAASKCDPRLGSVAGERFTVILRGASGTPACRAADRMRSFDSFTAWSGSPMIVNAGRD